MLGSCNSGALKIYPDIDTLLSELCEGVFDLALYNPYMLKIQFVWRFRDLLWKWNENRRMSIMYFGWHNIGEIFSFVKLIQTTNHHHHLSVYVECLVVHMCIQGFSGYWYRDFAIYILCLSGYLERLCVCDVCVCVYFMSISPFRLG